MRQNRDNFNLLRAGPVRQPACQRPRFPFAAVTLAACLPGLAAPHNFLWREESIGQFYAYQPTRPTSQIYFYLFQGIVMKQIKIYLSGLRGWFVAVGVRWVRFQCGLSGLYFRRVSYPVRVWVAAGRPAAFRPSLPWWHSFVFGWLRFSGWLRR